jgi:hypothetical protein
LLPAAVVEGFDRFQPRFALAVVDLPQIQHRPIDYPATRQAPLLSIAEIGVRFTFPPIRSRPVQVAWVSRAWVVAPHAPVRPLFRP